MMVKKHENRLIANTTLKKYYYTDIQWNSICANKLLFSGIILE